MQITNNDVVIATISMAYNIHEHSWVVLMSFHVANNCSVQRFDREGLRQVQNGFVPDEDLHGRNVVRYIYNIKHDHDYSLH